MYAWTDPSSPAYSGDHAVDSENRTGSDGNSSRSDGDEYRDDPRRDPSNWGSDENDDWESTDVVGGGRVAVPNDGGSSSSGTASGSSVIATPDLNPTNDQQIGDEYRDDPRQNPENWDPDVDDNSTPDSWDQIDFTGIDSGSWITDPESSQSVARPVLNLGSVLDSQLAAARGWLQSGSSSERDLPIVGSLGVAVVVAIVVAVIAELVEDG